MHNKTSLIYIETSLMHTEVDPSCAKMDPKHAMPDFLTLLEPGWQGPSLGRIVTSYSGVPEYVSVSKVLFTPHSPKSQHTCENTRGAQSPPLCSKKQPETRPRDRNCFWCLVLAQWWAAGFWKEIWGELRKKRVPGSYRMCRLYVNVCMLGCQDDCVNISEFVCVCEIWIDCI